MKKSALKGLDRSSQEYVVAHARWQRSRGRRPSVGFQGIRNPREALDEAEFVLAVYGTAADHAEAFGHVTPGAVSFIDFTEFLPSKDADDALSSGGDEEDALEEYLALSVEEQNDLDDLDKFIEDTAECDDHYPNNHF